MLAFLGRPKSGLSYNGIHHITRKHFIIGSKNDLYISVILLRTQMVYIKPTGNGKIHQEDPQNHKLKHCQRVYP